MMVNRNDLDRFQLLKSLLSRLQPLLIAHMERRLDLLGANYIRQELN